MKFGCVTLSYNQGNFLQEAISSIKKQSASMDYVIYDPGSTDKSREIALLNQSHSIRNFFVDGDEGPSDGLNRVLGILTGDIFYYLNADDVVLPGAFDFAESYFLSNPECDILHGSIEIINREGSVVRTLPSMKFTLRGYALGYSVVYQQATFIRFSSIKSTRFNILNRISWDGEFIVDLVISGARIHSTKKVLGQFRIYEDSITGSSDYREKVTKQHKAISKKILGRNKNVFDFTVGHCIRRVRAVRRRILPGIEQI